MNPVETGSLVTLDREQILSLIRAKTAEINVLREVVGLPPVYTHERASRRRKKADQRPSLAGGATRQVVAPTCCG